MRRSCVETWKELNKVVLLFYLLEVVYIESPNLSNNITTSNTAKQLVHYFISASYQFKTSHIQTKHCVFIYQRQRQRQPCSSNTAKQEITTLPFGITYPWHSFSEQITVRHGRARLPQRPLPRGPPPRSASPETQRLLGRHEVLGRDAVRHRRSLL